MEECFRELGVEYQLVEAVDGREMSDDSVRRDGLRVLPGYVEPYSKREALTFGEIGCFLSHHRVREMRTFRSGNLYWVHQSLHGNCHYLRTHSDPGMDGNLVCKPAFVMRVHATMKT